MKSKQYAVVDISRCVACGECAKVCPKGAIEIEKGSFAKVNSEICVGCLLCGKNCPAGVISAKAREA